LALSAQACGAAIDGQRHGDAEVRDYFDVATIPERTIVDQRKGGKMTSEVAVVRVLDIMRGLHARGAAKFVRTVERFKVEVWVTRGGETVVGTSIMGLLLLAADPGPAIIEVIGVEAIEAADALEALFARHIPSE
jgi:phosphocarrier protein HPr